MSKLAEQDGNEREPENAPLEEEDLEKVTGGTPAATVDSNLVRAQHEMRKGIIVNLRV